MLHVAQIIISDCSFPAELPRLPYHGSIRYQLVVPAPSETNLATDWFLAYGRADHDCGL
jgi:hypothetical protein